MKIRSLSALAVVAAVLVAPLAAHADATPGWYLGAGIGGTYTPDQTGKTSAGNRGIFYNPGFNLNGSAGYALDNGLRFEGEVWHSRTSVEAVHAAGSSNGHLSNTDFFANAFYDFSTGTMVTPYVGLGAGVAFADADHIGSLANGGSLNDSKAEFAYQAIAGVAAQLDDNWALTADYRYVASLDPTFKNTAGGSSKSDNDSHNIVLGVRYSFGETAAVAPATVVTPPAVPVVTKKASHVAPVAQSYMVFFDFDKADLTAEAKRILASAAADFKKGTYVKIVVTGHTDTAGKGKYNQKLSERRAEAVNAELQRLGVDAKVIKATGVGKKGLLIPTADGVREAQNRRAEIVFGKK